MFGCFVDLEKAKAEGDIPMRRGRKVKAKERNWERDIEEAAKRQKEAEAEKLPPAPVDEWEPGPDGKDWPVYVDSFGMTTEETRALLIALQRAWDKEPSPVGAAALRRMIDRIAFTDGAGDA